jgi:yersiniabactin nonribosomal peptide synthetase
MPDPQERSRLFDVETSPAEDQDSVANAVRQAGGMRSSQMPVPEAIAAFTLFWRGLEALSVPAMCGSLARMGVFAEPEETWNLDKIMMHCRVQGGFSKLLGQWLNVLTEEGLLVREASDAFRNVAPFSRDKAEGFWREVEADAAKHSEAATLCSFFQECVQNHAALFRGETNPMELLFPEGNWRIAESRYQFNPIADYYNRIIGDVVAALAASCPGKKPFRILEAGAGTGGAAASILPLLPLERTWYEYTDITPFFANHARGKFEKFPFVRFSTFDIDQAPGEQGYGEHSYDLVIAANVLHHARHIGKALKHLQALLAPGGWLVILEETRNIRIQMISVGFFEGFGHFEDQRLHDNLPFLSLEQWQEELGNAGFEPVYAFPGSNNMLGQAFFEQQVITARAPLSVERFRKKRLENFLREKLPEYMVPSLWATVDAWPLNRNGKIDRNALPVPLAKSDQTGEGGQKAPMTKLEQSLADIWSTVLTYGEVGIHDNFFEVGGDSLIAIKLTTLIRKRLDLSLSLGKFFENPTIAQLAEFILRQQQEKGSSSFRGTSPPAIIPDPEALHEPFPLTDIQRAYWLGRTGAYALGNVAAYCYFEIESHNLSHDQLTRAWRRLVRHHGMMRAVVLPGGERQRILAQVPEFVIPVEDLREVSPNECQKRLEDIRNTMSHQVITTDTWPLFDLRATLYGRQGQVRLHMGFDNLAFDGWSMFHVLNEWARLYHFPDSDLPAHDISFRDYVLAVSCLENSDFFYDDKTYWLKRLTTLPPSPELPLAQNPETLKTQRFERIEFKLDADHWTSLKNRASQRNLTPSGLMLAIFSEILAFWSKSPRFSLNLTLFNRYPLHPQINEIVGDFTSLTLLEVDRSDGATFEDRAARIQQQLWDDLDHPYFGGIRVIREYARMHGRRPGGVMPVVFTSALGVEALEDGGGMGDVIYSISQTPQVWLDHQVMEQQGALLLNWDFVTGLFPERMVPEMFHAYCDLIISLAEDEAFWRRKKFDLLPACQREKRGMPPEVKNPDELLHAGFVRHALEKPEAAALIFRECTLTYGDLFDLARQLGDMLLEKGCGPNTLVAVVMEKGWAQIAGVLGILFSGAAYLPIDPETPQERLEFLLKNGEAHVALTSSDLIPKLAWPEGVSCIAADSVAASGKPVQPVEQRQQPDDLAYVIYTSGSTGLPKGVMIDHRGAVNTVLDINSRFAVTPEDRMLALSSLHFDLSVYDIFGILAAGAALVMPEPEKRREPSHWADLASRHGVTLWNTVPALMQMFTEYLSNHDSSIPLRLVFLSGDWIPLELPERIRNAFHDCQVISLGGATEASIWSILHPVETVEPEWKSIPYGRSMKNQRVRVLNDFMDECPDWVPGSIYIEGIGLAQGYWKDEKKTAKSFLIHPDTGERLYRTGDLGCYLPDGSLRILGREDFQVKINGYRVELGEIECRFNQHIGIREAVVILDCSRGGAKLKAFLVLETGFPYNPEELKNHLARVLPEYMIPSVMIPINALPLTSNGKVDRKLLQNMKSDMNEVNSDAILLKTETEKCVASIIKDVAHIDTVGIQENFFDLGVDSLQLVNIQSRIAKDLNKHIDIIDFFKFPTVFSLSAHISEGDTQNRETLQEKSRSEMRRSLRKHRASQR